MELFTCMKSFTEVVEYNGFTNAARHANLPTSAYSKRISWLEDYLGVQLFERTTRRLSVTAAGKAYYERTKKILRELDEAKQHANETSAEPQGQIKLTMPSILSRSLIVPILADFFQQYPKIGIEVVTASSPVNVSDGLADMAITVLHSDDNQLVCEKLCTSRRHIYASPKYLKAHGTPKKINDLSKHQCLVNTSISPDGYWHFSDTVEIKAQTLLRSDSTLDLMAAAIHGLGLMWVADTAVKTEVSEGKLVKVPLKVSDPEITILMYYRPCTPKSPVRLLAKYLKSAVTT